MTDNAKIEHPAPVERRAPVQPSPNRLQGCTLPGTIAWSEHLEAYGHHAAKYGQSQSAERIAERGGFGYSELVTLLGHEPRTWRPRP